MDTCVTTAECWIRVILPTDDVGTESLGVPGTSLVRKADGNVSMMDGGGDGSKGGEMFQGCAWMPKS